MPRSIDLAHLRSVLLGFPPFLFHFSQGSKVSKGLSTKICKMILKCSKNPTGFRTSPEHVKPKKLGVSKVAKSPACA